MPRPLLSRLGFVLLAGVLLAVPPAAEAQERLDDRTLPIRYRLMALGGVSGLGSDGLHPYGGLEAGFLYRRVGILALGQYGSGNDFTSILVAGGPAVEVLDLGFASLTVYGGVGRYGEELASGFDRSLGIVYGALSVRVPIGRIDLGATASLWQGKLDDDAFEAPSTVRAHRFSFGVGF